MRLAFLSYEYPAETGFGGIGTYTWTQARALARLGHEVHVVAGSRAGAGPRRAQELGVTVWRAGVGGGAAAVGRALGALGLFWSRNRWENARALGEAFDRLAKERRFDVVEAPECGAEGWFVAGVEKRRRIVRFHSPARLIMPFYPTRRLDRALCAAFERRAWRRAGVRTGCSRFLAEAARDRLRVREPIEVIPNGVDLEVPATDEIAELRRALDLAGRRLVVFAGRIERRKGAHLLPEIGAHLLARPDVVLAIAGEDLFGILAREVAPRLAAAARPGALRILGRRTVTEARALVAAGDVVLLPSLWESCPYAALEAMACGAPLVTSDAGGLPECVRPEREALVAPAGDAAATATAALRLLDEPALARRLAAAARARVESEFSADTIARRSLALYERVAEGRAS
ncbi:MAG: glycosyltransferase family 4 protein [Thermoanaerobaculia bacterium]